MKGYVWNWRQIAEKVKDRAGWECEVCGAPHNPAAGYCLTVHHKDRNKRNNSLDNLVALCQRCHLKAEVYLNLRPDPRQLKLFDDEEFIDKNLVDKI
jgi:5-methylcytosine-specific restriction endonuclease McrA